MTEITIDKAALEAARRGWNESHPEKTGDLDKSMQAAIRAYLAALPPTTDEVRVTTDDEPYLWEGYWPGAGSIDSVTRHTRHKPTADKWIAEGVDVTPLYTARIMASLNISEVEPESVLLESACRTLMTKIYNRGHSGLDLDCPLCQAYIAVDRLLAWETGAAPSEEVLAWNRRTSPTTSPQAPEGVRDDAIEEAAMLVETAGVPFGDVWLSNALANIARRIRALKGNRT